MLFAFYYIPIPRKWAEVDGDEEVEQQQQQQRNRSSKRISIFPWTTFFLFFSTLVATFEQNFVPPSIQLTFHLVVLF